MKKTFIFGIAIWPEQGDPGIDASNANTAERNRGQDSLGGQIGFCRFF